MKFLAAMSFLITAGASSVQAATLLDATVGASIFPAPDAGLGNYYEEFQTDAWSSQSSEPFPTTVSSELSFDGRDGSTTSSSASVDYETGALKAYAEAITFASSTASNSQVGTATAELRDTLTFSVDESVTGPIDVQVLWEIDRIIDDFGYLDAAPSTVSPSATVTSIFGLRPIISGDIVSGGNTFTETGTDLFSDMLTLAGPGTYDYSLRFLLRATAVTRNSAGWTPSGEEILGFSALADASNTGLFNFVLPEGVTVTGGQFGFLSNASDLSPTAIPLPASAFLLFTALGGLLVGRLKATGE